MCDYPLSKVIVSASSAAVALAFDAGGTERQEDIWVGDLTEEEARSFWHCMGMRTSGRTSWMLVFQLNSTTCWLIKVCLLRSSCVHVFWGGTLTEFISGGFRIGDLAKACENLKRLA